jgi:hypothetical protein
MARREAEAPYIPTPIPKTVQRLAGPDKRLLFEDEKARMDDYGLPYDYNVMSPETQHKMRMAVWTGWFDPKQPDILCTDTEAYVKAHRLFVEFCMKPAACNKALYTKADPLHKYDMLRVAMAKPINPEEPTKTMHVAPRGTTKTVTMVIERCCLIACVRPDTLIIVCEVNKTRTEEEIGNIRRQFEENELIEHEFAPDGPIFNMGGRGLHKWSNIRLDFYNRASIRGVSAGSAARGRRAKLAIVDDGEDPKLITQKGFRRKYFVWFINSFCPMLSRGAIVNHISTNSMPGSCTDLMMKSRSCIEEESADGRRDTAFDDFHKQLISMKQKDKDGNWYSIWNELLTVPAIDKILASRYSYGMAELQGTPVESGDQVFRSEYLGRGYLQCEGADKEDYMIDAFSGERKPWREFIAELEIYAGVDLADGGPYSDPGAIVFVGFSPDGLLYVLDVWRQQKTADVIVDHVFVMCADWPRTKWVVFERAGMQRVVIRIAERKREEYQARGVFVPRFRSQTSETVAKPGRILGTLGWWMGEGRVRFRLTEPWTDEKGEVHKPIKHTRNRFHDYLRDEAAMFTMDKKFGIDALDAMEMAVRSAGRRPERGIDDEGVTETSSPLDEWSELGFEMKRSTVHRDDWPEEWHRDPIYATVESGGERMEMDPYDGF